MHRVVMESLEEYLSDVLEPAARRRIETHLSDCVSCRAEMDGLADVSRLFGALRNEAYEPAPGFYARVVKRIEAGTAPSLGLFGFDLAFARRLAFSCMLTLAVLGSVLVSREVTYRGSFTPEAVLSQDNAAEAAGSALAQDNMLLTLTAYER
ncbi:MAG TPA: zf-HC2 domain-containing protein [Bryobacteraceae bacterium]|jgi:anti-sigma factor RsiW